MNHIDAMKAAYAEAGEIMPDIVSLLRVQSRALDQAAADVIESLRKDATQMFAALEQSGSSNRLPDDLVERWKRK